MKSLQELLTKVSEDKPTREHILDFNTDQLLQFMPYPEMWDLKPDVTKEEWEQYYRPLKRGNVIGIMENYMKHAWDICLKRGLHSSRKVITHYHAWLWILDDYKTIKFLLTPDNFACFGAPILQCICEVYKWDFTDFVENWQCEMAQAYIEGEGC